MEKTYSLRHLGLFSKPILTVNENGFYYKGNLYTRADIKVAHVTGGAGQPQRLGVRLKDGKLIYINASALELNGKRAKSGFFSGTNEIFEDLKRYFLQPEA